MATRTRMAGSTSVQYEDFVPKYEWKEEQGANILHVHLPDFQKEQMKITYVHSSRTVRVLGERPVTNNKWKRFNQVFSVPLNCEVNKIQGRFQGGVLFITMPKTTFTQPVPREEAKTSKEASSPLRTAASPKTSTTEPKAGGKVLDETAGFASQKQKDGKKVEETLSSKEALKESKSEKGQDDASRKVSADTTDQKPEKISAVSGARVVGQTEQQNQREAKEAAAGKSLLEQEEISRKRKESLITKSDEGIKKRKESEELDKNANVKTSLKEKEKGVRFGVGEDKPKKDSIVEKVKGVKDAAAASAKKAVKGFNFELSEERKSLVNMGVAALVIVAVGAYIAYRFRSSGNDTDNQ